MKQWRLHFPVIIMSRVLRVSRSGFYTWLKRKPSRRTQRMPASRWRSKPLISVLARFTVHGGCSRNWQQMGLLPVATVLRVSVGKWEFVVGRSANSRRRQIQTTIYRLLKTCWSKPLRPAHLMRSGLLTLPTSLPVRAGYTLQGLVPVLFCSSTTLFSFQSNSVVMAIPGVNERYTGHFSACISWYWKTISFSSGLVERW